MKPPALARWVLRRVLPRGHQEPFLADLDEEFSRHMGGTHSEAASTRWYWRQAVASLPGALRLRLREWRFPVTIDLRFAFRRLLRSPAFTLFSVLTLALGIGATTAVYAVVRSVVGPPSGVRDADEIVNVYHSSWGRRSAAGFSWPDFQDLRARQTVFSSLAAWAPFGQIWSANGHAERGSGEVVTGDYFGMLGINPELGRMLQPEDEKAGARAVVVISHALWQRVFAGRHDALGAVLSMAGQQYEIVGVVPKEFRGLSNSGLTPTAVWMPTAALPPGIRFTLDPLARESRWVWAKGRLKLGRSVDEAAAEVARIGAQLDAEYPMGQEAKGQRRSSVNTNRSWTVRRLTDVRVNESDASIVDAFVMALMIAVGLVLMVVCTNLANLMLARGWGRRHEVAVRRALGASRLAVVRGIALEAAILAVAGGIAGLILARALTVAITGEVRIVGSGATMHLEPEIDLMVLLLACGATLLSLAIAGVVPALQATRPDVRGVLASNGAATVAAPWRGRRLLITGQVVVSLVLVALAALAVGQLRAQTTGHPGFDLQHLAVAQLDFTMQRYDPDRARQVLDIVVRDTSQRPGVVAATAATGLPAGISRRGWISLGGGAQARPVAVVAATGRVFDTLAVPVLHGRAFDERSDPASASFVIDELSARALFGRTNAVGQQVQFHAQPGVDEPALPPAMLTIVGVAAATDSGTLGSREGGVVYLPLAQQRSGRVVVAVRTSGDPADTVGALRAAIGAADPGLAVLEIGTGPKVTGYYSLFYETVATIAGGLGVLAWAIALAGLFGILSHLVIRRRREIAVRMALGASAQAIVRMVVREGLIPVILGIAAGLALAVLARQAVQPFLVRAVPAVDLAILVAMPLLCLAVGALACYVPARRAARVAPMQVLKE